VAICSKKLAMSVSSKWKFQDDAGLENFFPQLYHFDAVASK